jgi:hypothetical protein
MLYRAACLLLTLTTAHTQNQLKIFMRRPIICMDSSGFCDMPISSKLL